MSDPIIDAAPYIFEHVDFWSQEPCWIWTGDTSSHGYGQIKLAGRRRMPVHRASYEAWNGPLVDGLHVDHLCRVRACVNPEHLELVTQQENVRRGLRGDLYEWPTHCKNGHAMEGDNVGLRTAPSGRTVRRCIACNRMHAATWRARHLAE